jgi:hypothetical protein
MVGLTDGIGVIVLFLLPVLALVTVVFVLKKLKS